MKPACPRSFEAEAMRDGRLGDAERASFERHMPACAICSREVQAIETLAEALREESEPLDELHVRRERTRLLAAFDRALVTPEPRFGDRRHLLWPAACAAVIVGLFVFWRTRPAGHPSMQTSNAVVQAEGAAVWTKHTEGNRDKIVLEHGALHIHVTHSTGAEPLLVVLPDGELEDTGTTFTVNTENGRTTRVTVEEGSVVLRLRGRPPLDIGAGETWSVDARPAALASSGAPSAQPTPPIASTSTAPVASTVPPRQAIPSAATPNPSGDFRAAMAALDDGDNDRAAAAFAGFVAKHPQAPQAEDACYLRVIALQRSGDALATKEAAEEYLRRYPAGFRRAEVETLAR